jgi:D-amino-acid dehydrogenase
MEPEERLVDRLGSDIACRSQQTSSSRQSDTVLIIGGGSIGVCSAYYLAARGRDVMLLDKGEVCSGSSYGNAGLIVPSHSVPLAAPGVLSAGLRWLLDAESPFYIKPRLDLALLSWLWRFQAACRDGRMRAALPVIRDLQHASIALYDELTATGDLDCGYSRTGILMLYASPKGRDEAVEEAHLLAKYGIETKVLDGDAVRAMEPHVVPAVIGGVFYPGDAHLIPADFVNGLARRAAGMGVRFHPKTEVLGFTTSGKRITTVHTTRGDLQPAEVVLAGGSWSPELGRELGLCIPIQPAKGYSITVKRPATCPTVPLNLKEVRVAVTPMGETMRLAGTLELAGLDLSVNRRRVRAILKGARRYLGGLDALEVIEIWRGLRPCTPDGLPIISRPSAYENLIVAAGHATIGMSLGPITGKLVAQIACRETPVIDVTPLRASRF